MSDAVIFSPSKGFVCYWDSSESSRDDLERRLKEIGLETFVPPVRTNQAALKCAIADYVKDKRGELRKETRERRKNGEKVRLDKVVRPHVDPKQDGFQVVDETRRGDGRDNDYEADFSAKVGDDGVVSDSTSYSRQVELQRNFDRAKGLVSGQAIGDSLVEIVKHLGGTTLRGIGGIYWLPNSARDTWYWVIAAYQAAGEKTKVYMMPTEMDEQTTRAVADAIVSEISDDVGFITNEIASGSLGEEALANRKRRAGLLHDRVKQYEEILEKSLEHLHQVIQVAEIAATSAVAMQQDAGVFNEMYAGTAP